MESCKPEEEGSRMQRNISLRESCGYTFKRQFTMSYCETGPGVSTDQTRLDSNPRPVSRLRVATQSSDTMVRQLTDYKFLVPRCLFCQVRSRLFL
jgi:hypothetical protein